MQITFEGHACFTLHMNGKNILIDPFISGNACCKKPVSAFRPDLILLTHGHSDHLGDAVEIARSCNATIATQPELVAALNLNQQGINAVGFNQGGAFEFDGVRITMVPAWHSSSVSTPNGPVCAGTASGYMLQAAEGCIYHAGDTALFGDMQTVLSSFRPDVALLPIGDFYTMGPADAVIAARWLGAPYVIPMHYNTFPVIQQDANEFVRQLTRDTDCTGIVLQPGESWQLPARS